MKPALPPSARKRQRWATSSGRPTRPAGPGRRSSAVAGDLPWGAQWARMQQAQQTQQAQPSRAQQRAAEPAVQVGTRQRTPASKRQSSSSHSFPLPTPIPEPAAFDQRHTHAHTTHHTSRQPPLHAPAGCQAWSAAVRAAASPLVSIQPGSTALTRTRPAWLTACAWVRPSRPALAAAYASLCGSDCAEGDKSGGGRAGWTGCRPQKMGGKTTAGCRRRGAPQTLQVAAAGLLHPPCQLSASSAAHLERPSAGDVDDGGVPRRHEGQHGERHEEGACAERGKQVARWQGGGTAVGRPGIVRIRDHRAGWACVSGEPGVPVRLVSMTLRQRAAAASGTCGSDGSAMAALREAKTAWA
jgi:hypothetical protein